MKRWKLSPLLTIAMSIEMISSPVAYAIAGMNPLQMIQGVGQAIQQNQQNIAAQRNAQANQQLVAQMTVPGEDKYFKPRLFATIPGFNPNVMNCTTLPTTLTEIRAEVCRLGVTNDRGAPPQAQLAEMFSLYKTYGDVAKVYEGYRSNSNAEGQGFGVGCMRNALQALNGFLASKISDLDKTMMNITFLNDQFKEASRVDLDAIAESTAVLDGGNSELVNEVRTRRPDLFDFGKRFENPACKSMFAGDSLNTIGRGRPGGLNQISKVMRDEFAAKPAGSKFSAESYEGAHASVVQDINKMADKAAEQFRLNFSSITSDGRGYGSFLSGLSGSVSSTTGLAGLLRGDVFSDAQQSFQKENADITSNLQMVQDELSSAGVDPARALRNINNLNASNFESEVNRIQTQIRNSCVQRSITNWNSIKDKIIDPEASRFANSTYDSFRNEVQRIMTNSTTTPEQKIADLQRLEASAGSRFILNLQSPYTRSTIQNGQVVTSTVNPGGGSPPSSYFNDVVTTCEAQFNNNKLGSTLTGAGAIQTLRTINQQYQRLAQNQSNMIRNEIKRKLIECDSANEANNQQAGSCTRERFNTSTAGFCANAAFTCSRNMKSCNTQAQTFVTQIKNERTLRVNKYKQNMERNKNQIKGIAAGLYREYSAIGAAIGQLNLGASFGFVSPNLDTAGQGQYLDKFQAATQNSPDGALLLEDPDKYVDMLRENTNRLKQAFTKLQQDLTGRGGLLAQHIEQTDRNYQTAMREAEEISNQCIARHDEFVRQSEQQLAQQRAEQLRQQTELGERRQDFCNRFSLLSTNPNAACNGNIMDAVSAANAAGGQDIVQEFSRECARVQNENIGGENGSTPQMAAANICRGHQNGLPGTPRETPEGRPSQVTETGVNALKVYCARIVDPEGFCTRSSSTNNGSTVYTYSCDALYTQIIILGGGRSQASTTSNDSQGSDAGAPPAFCSAGFNGDRNDGSSLMNRDARNAALLGALGGTVSGE